MKSWSSIFRYLLLVGGLLLILPHQLIRYGIADNSLVSALDFPYSWLIGLALCAIGFGWPQKISGSSGTGDGIGWTSSNDGDFGTGDGGGGGD